VGRLLEANGIRATVLEQDPGQIETLRRFGFKVFYGNAARSDLLAAAGAAEARLLVLAVADPEGSLSIVETVQHDFPNLRIIARARDRVHAFELLERGVENFYRETFDSAVEMGVETLHLLGYRRFLAHRLGQLFKRHDKTVLLEGSRLRGD